VDSHRVRVRNLHCAVRSWILPLGNYLMNTVPTGILHCLSCVPSAGRFTRNNLLQIYCGSAREPTAQHRTVIIDPERLLLGYLVNKKTSQRGVRNQEGNPPPENLPHPIVGMALT
jgi:hypothetical protein